MMHAAYADEALTRSNVFRGYVRFRDGREDAQYDSRSGHPSEFRTEGNNENVRQLLLQNRHLSLRMTGHLRTTFYSLKSNPTLRDAVSTPFQTTRT